MMELLVWFSGFLFGTVLTGVLTESAWKSQLIKRGHAEYNQTTGKWQWKTGQQ